MLSISPPLRGGGRGDYYLNLAKEDYYLSGGEPPGKWTGRGAKELGLSETVQKEELRSLLEGYQPGTNQALVKNPGADNRQSAWDLTFSAPKSVSVLWSQADDGTRNEIQKAHGEAVERALQYLDKNAGFTRRGEGGQEREEAKLIFATFEHGTSRAQDPQLHTHALILNVCTREDGTTGTIESKEIYQNKMVAGALYRAELASLLERRIGLETERKNSWFEVKGVSEDLVKEFSKRREEIENRLGKNNFHSQRAHDIAALDTREVKEHQPREELFKQWQAVGLERGWSTLEAKNLSLLGNPERDPETQKKEAVNRSITKLTQHQSFFIQRDLIRAIAEEAQGRGLSASEAISLATTELSNNPEIVRLRDDKYTTKEILQLEKKMLSQVESLKERKLVTSEKSVTETLLERDYLSNEQKEAVKHITRAPGGIACVSGMAGTGKSTMLEAARVAWEKDGYEVIGAALSGKAAQGLEEGSGIKSETLHRTLGEISQGRRELSSKSIFLVDEAGMVGTRQMAEIISAVKDSGAKLVLVGDARQLQPVDAGGPFKAIVQRVGEAKLEEIKRQKEEWSKAAIKEFAFGDAATALERYQERGLVTISNDRNLAVRALVSSWSERGGAESPEKNLILSGNNSEVKELNRHAQQERFNRGGLKENSVKIAGENIFEGDRILFTKNSRLYGVRNGQLGSVERVTEKKIEAKLDNGQKVSLPLEKYPHIQLGYAVTTHKSQGMTVDNAFILAGGSMQDRELTYVQASRARGETRFFVDKLEAGDGLKDLSRQMKKSHQKELAVDQILERER